MPELPEVEIVCQNLAEMLTDSPQIIEWQFFRPDLRFLIPKQKLKKLLHKPILKVYRRAKYIIFDMGEFVIISHLGMTGAWRQEAPIWKKNKHDHLSFQTNLNKVYVYSDPRRFGFIEVLEKHKLPIRFKHMGAEPLSNETDFLLLTEKFKKLKAPIKSALMDQKNIVGVGNIYASEILFAAKVYPLKLCFKLQNNEYNRIWKHTRLILTKAIKSGGSTIENYKNSFGESGSFQTEFKVYGRAGELCIICHSIVKQKNISGRSTYWCPSCQK